MKNELKEQESEFNVGYDVGYNKGINDTFTFLLEEFENIDKKWAYEALIFFEENYLEPKNE